MIISLAQTSQAITTTGFHVVVLNRLATHAQTLHTRQFTHAPEVDEKGETEGGAGNGAESELVLFEKVLEIHAVQRGDKGACTDAKSANGEAQVEEHERIAVGVENSLDAGRELVNTHQIRD